MTGAGVVLAINLAVAGLLGGSFAMVAVYDRKQVAARWLGFTYGLAFVYLLIEFAISVFGVNPLVATVSFATFLGAMVLFNVGMARKYEVPVPWWLMGSLFVASVVSCYLIQDMPRQSFTRMMYYQAPYFMMQAIGAWIVFAARRRGKLELILMGLLAASSLQFLTKPFLSQALGGTGLTAQQYLQTNYAMVSQSMGTVFALAIALLFLVILARDILAGVTVASETDSLSGLLNRGGFERHARAALREANRGNTPLALVISDLDHFKSINDSYGHASGDRVIKAFAGFLRDASSNHHIAGRIGGEEFAIIMPGANLVSARLFAEGARSAFSGLPVAGLPENLRFTASFGVAELAAGEDVSELLLRADKALYEAKKGGRDCVRISLASENGRRSPSTHRR
ncbi:GGDEF domain-containing protein [Mesorhizobium sp. DCY119]|jgi:diguanylate cyclase (GGDEF)-like protein|uniref:GGDEF domain-containing protein n=1 Tax=Mesorhizobium sp. DCY119 TaxID=2108445 RepID=UPI000E6CAF8B|nr:GGDEF domain-containing protein [Mesorhizobium sp. DCY119]RJG43446.1 GGDEF domain-containing protein [Mesorhizobium sp. DCY119]